MEDLSTHNQAEGDYRKILRYYVMQSDKFDLLNIVTLGKSMLWLVMLLSFLVAFPYLLFYRCLHNWLCKARKIFGF